LLIGLFYVSSQNALTSPVATFLFFLWELHYFNRIVVGSYLMRPHAGVSLAVTVSALLFNMLNGFVAGVQLFQFSDYSQHDVVSPRFLLGLLMFFWGFIWNVISDSTLRSLRSNKEKVEEPARGVRTRSQIEGTSSEVRKHYKIPRGGLYDYVSSPNYFSETVEWLGFFLMSWSLGTFAFFAWVLFNLLPRALDHHRWYKEHFPEYPKQRKAFVPFLL